MNLCEMPIMRPVPIPTKGISLYLRSKTWVTSIRQWELIEDWKFLLPNGTKIVIPKGFVFDGASVPRPLWGILSPTGILFIPAIIHDYSYRYGFLWTINEGTHFKFGTLFTRENWDNLFYQVCQYVNGMSFVSGTAYLILWFFGRIAWNKHKNERAHNGMVY